MPHSLIMKNWTKIAKQVGAITTLLLLGVLVLAAVEKRSHRELAELDIQIQPLKSGQYLINEEDVAVIIENAFGHRLLGQEIGALDVARVEQVFERDPFIFDAEVYADAGDQIHIELKQREPLLRIIDKNGLSYYLDEAGLKMPLSDHSTARVLVATGEIPPHDPDYRNREENAIKDLFEIVNFIREDAVLNALVTQIAMDSKREITLVPNIGKQKILFGTVEDMQEKFEKLKTFYQEGMSRSGWHRYKTISLKYKDQVVCKKG